MTVNQCCVDRAPPAGGYAPEGARWACPACGREYVHVIEESEGCWWELVSDPEAHIIRGAE